MIRNGRDSSVKRFKLRQNQGAQVASLGSPRTMGAMDTLLLVLAVPLVTAVAVLNRRNAGRSWREAAANLGLSLASWSGPGGRKLIGHIGTAEIQVDTISVPRTRDGKAAPWTRIRASTDIPKSLTVGGETFWQRWNAEHGTETTEMAGVAFDDHVIVRGSIPEIFALLNAENRAQFRELEKQFRTCVLDGTVQLEHPGISKEPEELARRVRDVARLAMALSSHGPSIADRLGANVVTDSNPLVRLRNLEVLLERYPKTASAQLACEHAMGDRSYGVSVLAACHCGPDGFPTLERVLFDEKASLEPRMQALEHLAENLSEEVALTMLRGLMTSSPPMRPAATIELSIMGFDPGAASLIQLLENAQPDGWMAFAASIQALNRGDLVGPLAVLLEDAFEDESFEFTLPEGERDSEVPPEDGEPTPDTVQGATSAGSVMIPMPSELRLNLEVQQVALEAFTALVPQDEGSSDHETLDTVTEDIEAHDTPDAAELEYIEEIDDERLAHRALHGDALERLNQRASDAELEPEAE